MPLAALVCHCPKCKGEVALPPEETLDHAAKRLGGKFTYELLAAMVAANQERGDRISTTTLTSKCLRSEALKRFTPYEDDPEKLYASFRGTMFHGQLEKFAHPGAVEEARFHVDLEGLGHFTGSPDLVDPKTGYLYDYKFSKENPRFDYPWKDHVLQMQVNRWLVDNADYVEYQDAFYPLTEHGYNELHDGISVNVPEWDLRTNRARFQPIDWQGLIVVYMDDKGPKPLLVTRSEQVPKKDGKGTRAARVADIWSDDVVLGIIRNKYVEAQRALDANAIDAGQVPDIPDEFTAWLHPLCGFCPVKADCVSRYIDQQVELRQAA